MAVAVNIIVKDTTFLPQPISGVVVNVYDSQTLALAASGTSDVDGQIAFLLPGVALGTAYEVRLFKSGIIFANPKAILVLDPVVAPNTNNFDVSGTLTSLPVASDPRMCRCTGQFINFGGVAVQNTLVRIVSVLGAGSVLPVSTPTLPLPQNLLSGFQIPKVLDGKMVSVGEMEIRSDVNGKVSVDLIRGGQYYVTFAGEEDVLWPIHVPDRSSVNLIDLIHPSPASLTWNQVDAPSNAVTVAIQETKNIALTVLFTNYQTYASNLGNILTFTNSNGTLADVFYNSGLGCIQVLGKVAGTLTVTVSFLPNMMPSRSPDYSIGAAPLTVTVVP